MERTPQVVSLDDDVAPDATAIGAKAANLAIARQAGLPALTGMVLTTAWKPSDQTAALGAWRAVSANGAHAVVVRSSSTGEDGAASSMAGVFDSVLDVAGDAEFLAAVEAVLGSAAGARRAGLVDAPMAVLVQPMLRPRWGGVLFGADPVTGRRDRLVVAAVPGGPALVSGEVDGWTAVLDRRGRVREVRSAPDGTRPPAAALRPLARLAATAAAATYGGPQDIEAAGRATAPARGWRAAARTSTTPSWSSPSTAWPPPTSTPSVPTSPPGGWCSASTRAPRPAGCAPRGASGASAAPCPSWPPTSCAASMPSSSTSPLATSSPTTSCSRCCATAAGRSPASTATRPSPACSSPRPRPPA